MSRGEPEAEAMEAEVEWMATMLKDDVLVAQMLMQLSNGKRSSSPPRTSRPLRRGRTRNCCLPSTASLHGWYGGTINEKAQKAIQPLMIAEAGRNTDGPLSPLEWNARPGTRLDEVRDSLKSQKRWRVDLAVNGAQSTSDRVNGDRPTSTVELQPPTSEELKVEVIHTSEVSDSPSVAPENESHEQPSDLAPTAASLLTSIAGNLESLSSDDVHENAATAGTCYSTSLPGCNRSAILTDLNLPLGDWF